MNMIMDSGHSPAIQRASPLQECPQPKDLEISTTPPTPPNDDSYPGNPNSHQLSPKTNLTTTTTTTKGTLKRSFDVAFLMMPDERLKNNRPEKQKPQIQLYQQPGSNKQPEISVKQDLRRYPQITVKAPRIYDDPTVIISSSSSSEWESSPLRSAFTKVPSRLESPGQPAPSLSPDQLSCSSMSPPVATTPPRSASGSSSDIISIDSMPSSPSSMSPNVIYQNFRPEYTPNGGAFHAVQNLQTQRLKQQLVYRPGLNQEQTVGPPPPPPIPNEFLPVYPGFPFPHAAGTVPHPFANLPHPELPRIVQNPAAAAILSTLIPPTLASTFTLTAQNVCAKCNISFRMTSDLVYHMRSHHKSEVATDPNRRKREEKLKCPVCQESFRERHHLTRHMTAHQDKESDQTTTTTATGSLTSANMGSQPSNSRSNSQRSSGYTK